MTVDEKRKNRVELQIGIEDAESDFIHCQDRARGVARGLQEVAEVILRNTELEPSANDFSADAELENRLTPTQLGKLQDWKSVMEIFGELKCCRQALYNLKKRRADLQRVAAF